MLHEALLASELAERGELSLRVVAMPWLNRFDADWLAEVAPSSTSSCSRTTRRSVVSATGSARRARPAARSRSSASRAGPRAGRPTRRFASTAGRRLARRADRARVGVHSSMKRTWVVLPDQLSIRVFVDTGIVSGLHERLDGRLAAVFLVPRGGGRVAAACRGIPVLRRGAHGPGRAPERVLGRLDAWLDRRLGYHPLAIRLNYRHGFHAERMQPGHPNWMLDSDRDGPLPTGRPSSGRWSAGSSARDDTSRGGCSRRCDTTARGSCSRTCSPRARCRSSRARRLRCRWSRTSRAGTTRSGRASSRRTATLYVVQNRVMEDDLRRYHGIDPSGCASPGGRRRTLPPSAAAPSTRAPAAVRARPSPPARARRGEHAEQRTVRGALRRAPRRVVGTGRRASALQLLFRPHPRDREWRERFGGGGARGRRRAGGELHRPRRPRDAASARRRRRLQRGHDPPRRARRRPARPSACSTTRARRRVSRGRRRTSSASTTRSSPASGAFYRAERFEEVVAGIERASSIRTSSRRRGAGRSSEVVGEVDGSGRARRRRGAEALGNAGREARHDPARPRRGGRRRRADRVPPARRRRLRRRDRQRVERRDDRDPRAVRARQASCVCCERPARTCARTSG